MKSRRLTGILLALSLVFTTFTACDSATKGTSTPVASSGSPAATSAAGTAANSKYPEKPVTIIVPYAAGGGTDVGTRIIAKYAEKYFGKSFVIQNVEGGGGEIGFSQMVRSKPDGYTIAAMTLGHVTLTTTRKASYDPNTDIKPISLLVRDPSFLVVRADDNRFKDIDSVIEYAKANPNKFTLGTSGAGSSDHIGVLAVNLSKSIEIKPVHYGGAAEAKAAMLGGHVDAFMPTTGEVLDLVKEGKAKMIATSADERLTAYPDVPTFKEKGINAPIDATRGFAAPKGIPDDVLQKLDDAFRQASQDPAFLKDMADMGLPVDYLGHADYTNLIKQQYDFFKEMATHLTTG